MIVVTNHLHTFKQEFKRILPQEFLIRCNVQDIKFRIPTIKLHILLNL